MDIWHSLDNGIDITINGGVWYIKVWGRGRKDWYYHEWMFVARDEVFAYVDWCDMYCDKVLYDLLVDE